MTPRSFRPWKTLRKPAKECDVNEADIEKARNGVFASEHRLRMVAAGFDPETTEGWRGWLEYINPGASAPHVSEESEDEAS